MVHRNVVLKRKQNWPLGVEKGPKALMQTNNGQIQMLGHVVGNYFYTPDIGQDKWEVWDLSSLKPIGCESEELTESYTQCAEPQIE